MIYATNNNVITRLYEITDQWLCIPLIVKYTLFYNQCLYTIYCAYNQACSQDYIIKGVYFQKLQSSNFVLLLHNLV